MVCFFFFFFFFSSRRRHTRWTGDWSSDVCSSDLVLAGKVERELPGGDLVGGLQLLAQIAQDQVGQVEGALAGQGEVGGERGVGGQPAQDRKSTRLNSS